MLYNLFNSNFSALYREINGEKTSVTIIFVKNSILFLSSIQEEANKNLNAATGLFYQQARLKREASEDAVNVGAHVVEGMSTR